MIEISWANKMEKPCNIKKEHKKKKKKKRKRTRSRTMARTRTIARTRVKGWSRTRGGGKKKEGKTKSKISRDPSTFSSSLSSRPGKKSRGAPLEGYNDIRSSKLMMMMMFNRTNIPSTEESCSRHTWTLWQAWELPGCIPPIRPFEGENTLQRNPRPGSLLYLSQTPKEKTTNEFTSQTIWF